MSFFTFSTLLRRAAFWKSRSDARLGCRLVSWLGFNVTTPPFDEVAVRDAISKAVDVDMDAVRRGRSLRQACLRFIIGEIQGNFTVGFECLEPVKVYPGRYVRIPLGVLRVRKGWHLRG
jgi:hypothetical protein